MTTLFPLDQEANDQLLLAEVQRKQDLIDLAVSRFAPHLDGKPDLKVVHLYSTNATLRKEIRALCGGRTICVEHVITETRRTNVHEMVQTGVLLNLPTEADFVATRTALNSKTEWLAARLHALPVVLPEATEYLLAALARKRVLVIVGAEQAKC